MNDNELKAYLIHKIGQVIVILSATITTLGLYYMSQSWISLIGLLFLFFTASLTTGKAAEIEATAKLEEQREYFNSKRP